VARESAARAAAPERRRSVQRLAARIWSATANPDGPGLLERGSEFQPVLQADLDARVVHALVRLARLADSVAEMLRECPDAAVRRSAAVLAARAHPVRAGLDE
jgi:hypothetical protein